MAASSSIRFDYSVAPKGDYRATMIWLHDKGEHFSNSFQFVKTLNLKNVKWICPHIVYTNKSYHFGSNMKQDDREALDSAAEVVVDILLREPPLVLKGVGGVGMGATVALHFATNCALIRRYPPLNLRVVVGIKGWLSIAGSIKNSVETTFGAAARAASQSILLSHGLNDRVAPYASGEQVVVSLREAGFEDVIFVPFQKIGPIGHEVFIGKTDEVRHWLEDKLKLDVANRI